MGELVGDYGLGWVLSVYGVYLESTYSRGNPALHKPHAIVAKSSSDVAAVRAAIAAAAAAGEAGLQAYFYGLPASPMTGPTPGSTGAAHWDALPTSLRAELPAFITMLVSEGRI